MKYCQHNEYGDDMIIIIMIIVSDFNHDSNKAIGTKAMIMIIMITKTKQKQKDNEDDYNNFNNEIN